MEDTLNDFELAQKSDDGRTQAISKTIVINLENKLKKLNEKDARQKDAYEDGIYSKEEFLKRNVRTQQDIASTIIALEDAKIGRASCRERV